MARKESLTQSLRLDLASLNNALAEARAENTKLTGDLDRARLDIASLQRQVASQARAARFFKSQRDALTELDSPE